MRERYGSEKPVRSIWKALMEPGKAQRVMFQFNRLISNIGGQGASVCGISIVTFFEFVFLMMRGVTIMAWNR